MARNWYAEAIKLLVTPAGVETYLKVCAEVAQTHPRVFVEAYEKLLATVDPWKQEVKALVAGGKKIEAIKLWRAKTGNGLQESKDAVERLCPECKDKQQG